ELRSRDLSIAHLCCSQMRHHTQAFRIERAQAFPSRLELLQTKAEPVHSRIDFQPNFEVASQPAPLEHRDLLGTVHDDLQRRAMRSFELFDIEYALEQHDRRCDIGGAQLESLFEARDTESLG